MNSRTVQALLLLPVAWGVLAFGAVYPWAYWPMATGCVVAGIIAMRAAGPVDVPSLWIPVMAGLVAAAIVVQVVPLDLETLRSWSPATVDFLNGYDLQFATGLVSAHAISIDPPATLRALVLFLSLVVLAVGVARWVSAVGVRGISTGLTVIGGIVAMVGIVQRPLFAGKIYGFWTPVFQGQVFGPFVNKNHFAGWMMMALPVVLALLLDKIDTALVGGKPTWRDRLAWMGSQSATRLVLQAIAVTVMALSLVMTLSRSGIAAFLVAMVVSGIFLTLGAGRALRKVLSLLLLSILVAGAVSWVGVETITNRFVRPTTQNYNDRRGAWDDAERIAAAFPLAGTGINTYGVATVVYQRYDLSVHYVQAHNDYLQLAAEGGWLVAVPAALLALTLVGHIVGRFRDHGSTISWRVRAGAVTGILAIGLQSIVDFSLQMPGNAALFAVLLGLAVHRAPQGRRVRGHGERSE